MSSGMSQVQFQSMPLSIDIKITGGTAKNKAVLCLDSHRCLKAVTREHVFPLAGPGMVDTGC